MRARLLPGSVALAIALGVFVSRAQRAPDSEQDSFAKLPGKELVQRLMDEKSRSRAFYELWRRSGAGKDEGFDGFEEGHYDPSVIVCPQEKGELPIYIVLCGFLGKSDPASRDGYSIEKPNELFASAPGLPPRGTGDKSMIEAFTADGRRIVPFGGNNVLDGVLADINADGMIDRVEVTNYGVDGVKNVQALTVSTVKVKEQPLFTVVLNWEADEWTFRLTDQDGDRISDIEAGPRTAAGFKPKAVWKWDRAKHEYLGPAGKPGDHFRVIDSKNIWKELERFKTAKLTFPKDADAVPESDDAPAQAPPAPSVAANSEPYHYSSLKGSSDAGMFQFMARGKSEQDRELEAKIRNRLPESFWTMDAKKAALTLINANRTDAHRAHFQIAIDDRDKAGLPARCTIAFSDSSSRCYNAVDAQYFLRVDPQDSYLAYARSWAGGVVFYSAVHDQPAFDLRLCPLRYVDARKIAEVIWWLDRVRTRSTRGDSSFDGMHSTADGHGKLTLRADAQTLIERSDTLWSAYLSERWNGDYNHASFLNFAAYLMADALPARLGNDWSQFEPKHQQDIIARQNSAPAYTDEERKRLRDLGERFLSWFSPDQERISFSIVAEAARLAAGFAIGSAAERLRAIESALPPPGPAKRRYEEVSAEREKLPHPFEVKDREKRKVIEQRRAALDEEITAILHDHAGDSPGHLRRAIVLSRRQVAAANDAEQLHAWAISKSEGHQWAFQRLARIDPKRYADALESLMHQADGKWARQFFHELAQTDPKRAADIARDLPAEKKDALAVSAFLLLREAENVPDEAKRVATIIKILHDPKSGWEERGRAVGLLVPRDAPLRYPGREVDDALLKLFEPGQADELINFSLERACRALALRGRTDLFDRIAKQLKMTKDPHLYHGVLGALTHLAQSEPSRFNPRLLAILKPHLSHTDKHMAEILWAIWSADLRELRPDLERLATRSTDEYEDRKAHSYGGTASPVTGRFHFARKIVGIWSEPDAFTRARLLAAFAATEAYEFVGEPKPERLARMKAEMNRAGAELSAEAKTELAAFLKTIDSVPAPNDGERVDPETLREITAFARSEFRL
jgi:hypothetical protein